MEFEQAPAVLGDRYELVAPIGHGGFAVTYRAHDRRLRRIVAVKVLRRGWGTDPRSVARFEREAQAAAAISSPYVVPVYDFGVEAGDPYLVMEYVPGGTLRDWLDRDGPFPAARAMLIARDMLRGLAAIHAKGIVHRDVKPQNVLIAEDMTGRMADFGIAQFHGHASITQTGMAMGTAIYMAPEQVLGATVGPAADLYAVGVVLFEMVAGRGPFTGNGSIPLFFAHVNEAPPLPSEIMPGLRLPVALEREVMRALAKDPSERRPSAAAMEGALAAAVAAPMPASSPAAITAPFAAATTAATPRALPSGQTSPAARAAAFPLRRLGGLGPLIAILLALAIVAAIAGAGRLDGLIGEPRLVATAPAATETAPIVADVVTPSVEATEVLSAEPTGETGQLVPAPPIVARTVTADPDADRPNPATVSAPADSIEFPMQTTAPVMAEPTADAEPTAIEEPPVAAPPGAVTFTAADWRGAMPAPAEYERNAVVLYGADGAAPRAALRFTLAEAPTAPMVLTVSGLGDESGRAFPFGIEINGMYAGESPATFDGWDPGRDGLHGERADWDQVRITLSPAVFQAGRNEIALVSVTPGDYNDRPPYLLLGAAILAPK